MTAALILLLVARRRGSDVASQKLDDASRLPPHGEGGE